MIKLSIHWGSCVSNKYMHTSHQGSQTYKVNIDTNEERNGYAKIVRDIVTPLSVMNNKARQKVNMRTENLNNTANCKPNRCIENTSHSE